MKLLRFIVALLASAAICLATLMPASGATAPPSSTASAAAAHGSTLTAHGHQNATAEKARVVNWDGTGQGAKDANVRCPATKHRLRVWKLWPGPDGKIRTVGALAVRMATGKYVILRGSTHISRVGRHWEIYQFGHSRVDTVHYKWTYAFPVNLSVHAAPKLKLAVSDCESNTPKHRLLQPAA